jgi:hypothetical protein
MLSPAEEKYKDTMIKAMAEVRRLFSNSEKTEREKMTCRGFIRCIGVRCCDKDLAVGPYEPIDVAFGEAKFQVTEVLGDRRRDAELRQLETKYETACSSLELLAPMGTPEPISLSEIAAEVRKRLETKYCKLREQGCRGIDALVHINLSDRYLYPLEFTRREDMGTLEAEGWRSVSVLIVPYAAVLFANDTAPAFLKDRVGKVHRVDDDMINHLFDA